jgi:alkylated DNA repair protein (DNA oxidative demethylase)
MAGTLHDVPGSTERRPAEVLAPGLVHHPGFPRPRGRESLARGRARRSRGRAAIHPAHAAHRKALLGAHDQCRPARLGVGRAGLPLPSAHPETGEPWPPIPAAALRAWEELSAYPHPPEACLVNLYGASARIGLHQDRDEEDFDAPVLSLSLGDTGLFRFGGTERRGPTRSVRLLSGDALLLGGPARLAFHGIDRLLPGTSDLLREGGRINLTLRRVTRP